MIDGTDLTADRPCIGYCIPLVISKNMLARKHLTPRYPVCLGQQRTPVSLGRTLAERRALKLGQQPHSCQSHTMIRYWLQLCLDADNDPSRYLVRQWLQFGGRALSSGEDSIQSLH